MIARRQVRLSWVLWAVVAVAALIALNRGIDLLWGMTILLSVAVSIAILLPKLQVQGVRAERLRFPTTGIVGQQLELSYRVEASGWWPRYGIEIRDDLPGTREANIAAYVAQTRGCRDIAYLWTPQVRGCWLLGDIVLESRYPLGLTRARRRLPADPSSHVRGSSHELVIYPDSVPLRWLPVRGDANPRAEHRTTRLRGGQDEFFGVRSHRPEDPLRSVHWHASARLGELVVKEHEHPQDRQLWIVLELSEDEHVGDGASGTFECMIRIAHSVALKAHEDGVPVGLLFDTGARIRRIQPGADRSTYLQLREALARVEPIRQPAFTSRLEQLWETLPSGGAWLLFNPRDPAGRAALHRGARQRSAHPVYIEFDHDSFMRELRDTRVRTQLTAHGLVSIVAYGSDLSELFRCA